MNLTDREILELNELCGAVVDGTLTGAQRERLAGWLCESEAVRQYYVRALGQSASLHTYAAELHAEAPDVPVATPRVFRVGRGWSAALAAAAVVALGLWFGPQFARKQTATEARRGDFVALVSGVREAQWTGVAPQPGDRLHRSQRLELAAGLVEITFDSGARVVLEGPASLDINSAWDGTLRRGTLKASVPLEAIGFRIANSAVEVVDLGTEFTMIADGRGAAEVLVLKGAVEAAPRADPEAEPILLRENESRRFASSGVSGVRDPERISSLFAEPLALDRFSPLTRYVHWSFDEDAGGTIKADFAGTALEAFDAHLNSADPAALAANRTEGRRRQALRFDGRFFAKARFPGISSSAPRTVAFWVKVPDDAVTDAWMLSWGTQITKLNSRPVQISWNRRPAEGSFGALRTDFGGGYAIGSHDLRDGRWHHVAVYFSAGDDPAAPVQVKQYIDGRLESSTITLTPGRSGGSVLPSDAALVDTVWLGCRLTGKRPERFQGDIDELFIADRGLEPNEIVSLMNDNRLPVSGLASAAPGARLPSP